MAIVTKKQAAIPVGEHEGMIISAVETTKIFDGSRGPEPVVEITIAPAWRQDATTETLAVSFVYSPVLNGLSGLSKFLQRLNAHPADGETWEPSVLLGLKVRFKAGLTDRKFIQVDKDSVRLAA